MRVYVAAPYTKGDRSENMRRAMKAMDDLIAAGHDPFLPILTHFQDLCHPRPWEDWMRVDLAWLPFAEAVVRLPGASVGADMETVIAREDGIPVFDGVEAFLAR